MSINIHECVSRTSAHTVCLILFVIEVVAVMSIQKRSGRCELCLLWSQHTVMSSLKSWNLVMRHDQVEIEEHLSLSDFWQALKQASRFKCCSSQWPSQKFGDVCPGAVMIEAWESDCINSSDEPLRFPGIDAGNPLFTENERDTLESVIQREEMWRDMLHLKRGKQLKLVCSFKVDIWN